MLNSRVFDFNINHDRLTGHCPRKRTKYLVKYRPLVVNHANCCMSAATGLCFKCSNLQPARLLFCFPQEKGINLTHIESRPSRTNQSQYEFFINVDSTCSQALDEVIDGLRTQISGQVHELSRNKEKDTGLCAQKSTKSIALKTHGMMSTKLLIKQICRSTALSIPTLS